MKAFFLVCVALLGYNSAPQSGTSRNWGAKFEPILTMDSNLENTVVDNSEKYKLSEERISQFWERVEVKPSTEDCWPWKAYKTPLGYGKFKAFGNSRSAHGIAYFIYWGKHWNGLHVCHTCDNPECCNPFHLFVGTNGDNARDRHAKGRDAKGDRHGSRLHPESWKRGQEHWASKNPELVIKGSDHGGSKLTEEKVREIRRLYATGQYTQTKLGEMFNVHFSNIGYIVHRRAWKHVT